MEPQRKPYRGIPEDMRDDLRKALGNISGGNYIFTYAEVPDSDFEKLYNGGVLWKRQEMGPRNRVTYGLTKEAKQYLGIDAYEEQQNKPKWERKTQPRTLPKFEYRMRMPLVTMDSEADRKEFMRNFIGRLENTEFGRRNFEDFLFEF